MRLKDVAKNAGVSLNSVRKVLSEDPTVRHYIKDRVLKSVQELDYHPNLVARALRDQALRLVPISVVELHNPYFGSLAGHLSRHLADAGLEPAMCLDGRHLLRMSQTLSVCGCILGYGYDDALIRALSRRQKVVNISPGGDRMDGVATVSLDFSAVYRAAVHALVKVDRRHVAVCSRWMALWGTQGVKSDKFESVFAAIEACGLKCVSANGQGFFPTPVALADFLSAHPGAIDAVLCENDTEAAMLYGHLASRGLRVPGDVLIVGCDANHILPGMWSVKIDTAALAQEAVGLLQRLLAGESEIEPHVHQPVLVDSDGRPVDLIE